jgi:hypothetical protein
MFFYTEDSLFTIPTSCHVLRPEDQVHGIAKGSTRRSLLLAKGGKFAQSRRCPALTPVQIAEDLVLYAYARPFVLRTRAVQITDRNHVGDIPNNGTTSGISHFGNVPMTECRSRC